MIRNKDKRVTGHFVTSVLWKYIVFSIVLVLLLVALFFAAVWNTGRFQGIPYMKELQNAFEGLEPSAYDSVDVKEILGRGSYIQVLNEKNQVIYCSDPTHKEEAYTDYELDYIANSDDFTIIVVEEFEQENGAVETLITVNSYDKEGDELYNDVYAVDEDLNILYSNVHKEKTKLTQREFQFLTDTLDKKVSLSKTSFVDADGQERTLLAFSPRSVKNTVKRTARAYLTMGLTFLFLYTVVAFIFSLWIASRVKKPLRMLKGAMEKISAGDSGTVLSYRGPKEFVEICENFNDMSLALDRANRENAKLEAQKQKMIADISHDLKTPITVIKGYSKAVADGLTAPSEQEKYLQTIYQRSSELADLIEEFHEYAKLDHPDSAMELAQADLCEFTREYFAEKYNEFSIGGYDLVVDIGEEKVPVNLDRKQFRKVLDNITGNFFKYCEEGETFYCRIETEEKEARLILADDGKGIPAEIRDTIFEPFVVGEKSRTSSVTGSGLGLPLVKRIIEAHGGTIVLASADRELETLIDDGGEKKLTTQFVITLQCIEG